MTSYSFQIPGSALKSEVTPVPCWAGDVRQIRVGLESLTPSMLGEASDAPCWGKSKQHAIAA